MFYDGTTIEARISVVTGYNEPVYKPIKITNKCSAAATVNTGTSAGETIVTLNRSSSGRTNIKIYMNTLFTDSNEANCKVPYAYELVTDADTSKYYKEPSNLIDTQWPNYKGNLNQAYFEFKYPSYGTTKKADIVFKVRYLTWYANPATPLYHKMIFRDQCND